MSFRTRLTLVAAAAVALAVIAASVVVFIVVRNQLSSQVDNALRSRGEEIRQGHLELVPFEGRRYLLAPQPLLGAHDYVQLVDSTGRAYPTQYESGALPASKDALRVARGLSGSTMSDAKIGESDVRVLTLPVRDDRGNTYALQVARSLEEFNHTLRRVTIFLILIAAGGIAIALGLGLAVSRAALAPGSNARSSSLPRSSSILSAHPRPVQERRWLGPRTACP